MENYKAVSDSEKEDDGRELPPLTKGMKIYHKVLGEGEVRRDEQCGVCLILFSGKKGSKKTKGARDIFMRTAHKSMKIIGE